MQGWNCARIHRLGITLVKGVTVAAIAAAMQLCLFSTQAAALSPTPERWRQPLAAGADHNIAIMPNGSVWAWGLNQFGQVGDGTTETRRSPVAIVGLPAISAVAAGEAHSLARTATGAVWTWGLNQSGQLGDGSLIDRPEPVQVPGLTKVLAVAGGLNHSLALRADGTVWAWGDNSFGQVGDGSNTQRLEPVPVIGLAGITAIAAGGDHSLALRADGTVWAWGRNENGQLGIGSTVAQPTPVRWTDLADVKAISAGLAHSLALKADGSVWAWGVNSFGQLGIGPEADQLFPRPIDSLAGAVQIAAGDRHSLALRADGTVYAWGDNSDSQLGIRDAGPLEIPTLIPNLAGVWTIQASKAHSLAVTADGTLWGWGKNDTGQLGDGSQAARPEPVSITRGISNVHVRLGFDFALLASNDGSLWAWGEGAYGQLGTGERIERSLPVQIADIDQVIQVAPGFSHSVALRADGTVMAWGDNQWDQLGSAPVAEGTIPGMVPDLDQVIQVGAGYAYSLALRSDGTVWFWGSLLDWDGTSLLHSVTPTAVTGLDSVVRIAAGSGHALALRADGSVWAWGLNYTGQLGDLADPYRLTPAPIAGVSQITAIAAATEHSLAVRADGAGWAWGVNYVGQIGDGSAPSDTDFVGKPPGVIADVTDIADVTTWGSHSVALTGEGRVWAWGTGNKGELGNGDWTEKRRPAPVTDLQEAVQITASNSSALALKGDGTVAAWGSNQKHELGDGSVHYYPLPIPLLLPANITEAAGGYGHTLALDADGTVWTAGRNWRGELGDGSTTVRPWFKPVSSLEQVVAVDAGFFTSIALDQAGSVWTWGRNMYGQVGDETFIDRSVPTQVMGIGNDIVAIAAGSNHMLALQSAAAGGRVWAWGNNVAAQMGGASNDYYQNSPVQIPVLTDITAISAGNPGSLAIKSDGTLWQWSGFIRAGTPLTDPVYYPKQVDGLADVTAISAGPSGHYLAITADGTVWSWGRNYQGQLGDGTTNDRTLPAPVPGLTDMVGIIAGYRHSLALKRDGTVWAWGSNSYGQLGDGNEARQLSPVQVSELSGVVGITGGDNFSMAVMPDGSVQAWGDNQYGQFGEGSSASWNQPTSTTWIPYQAHQPSPPIELWPRNNVWVTANSPTLTWTFQDVMPEHSQTGFQINIREQGATLFYDTDRLAAGDSIHTLAPETLTEQTDPYVWTVRTWEESGAFSPYAEEVPFRIDLTPPTGSLTINGGAPTTNQPLVTLTTEATDATSGLAAMRFGENGIDWTAWEPYAMEKPYHLSNGTGTKSVYVQYSDVAGNQSVPYEGSIERVPLPDPPAPPPPAIDLPPSGTILIDDGKPFTGSRAVQLELTATDDHLVEKMRFAEMEEKWSEWEPYNSSRGYILTDGGDGDRSVLVQYRDNGANFSIVASDSIFLDRTPPVGSIQINNGDATTQRPEVTLSLAATDSGSGVHQMRLSDDGQSWTQWMPFSRKQPYSLSADEGNKRVFVQFRDLVGNQSPSYQDQILLIAAAQPPDRLPPPPTTPAPPPILPGQSCIPTGPDGKLWRPKRTFIDILTHWARYEIEILADIDVVFGYPDNLFRPDRPISRAEWTAMIVRFQGLPIETAAPIPANSLASSFPDVESTAWYASLVGAAKKAGLVKGYEDGSFRPDQPIHRQELALLLARMLGEEPDTKPTRMTGFADDRNVAEWAAAAVAFVREQSLMIGYQNRFGPVEPFTRAEASVVLARLIKRQGQPGICLPDLPGGAAFPDIVEHPHRAEITYLARIGLIFGQADGRFNPEQPITRGDLETWGNRLLGVGKAPAPAGADHALTRQEMILYLMQLRARLKGITPPDQTRRVSTGLQDDAAITDEATSSVAAALALGLIQPEEGNRIRPSYPATRAEAALLLHRIVYME